MDLSEQCNNTCSSHPFTFNLSLISPSKGKEKGEMISTILSVRAAHQGIIHLGIFMRAAFWNAIYTGGVAPGYSYLTPPGYPAESSWAEVNYMDLSEQCNNTCSSHPFTFNLSLISPSKGKEKGEMISTINSVTAAHQGIMHLGIGSAHE